MGYFSSLNRASSALTAQRLRMDTITQNIANVNTTRTEDGSAYRRKTVLFEEREFSSQLKDAMNANSSERTIGSGVRVSGVVEDQSPLRKVYEPGHPDADEEGFVEYPNIEVIVEMVNMISATKAYDANVTSINSIKSMAMKALEIGR
jgi:flagellar basal-body rod protein FlgC